MESLTGLIYLATFIVGMTAIVTTVFMEDDPREAAIYCNPFSIAIYVPSVLVNIVALTIMLMLYLEQVKYWLKKVNLYGAYKRCLEAQGKGKNTLGGIVLNMDVINEIESRIISGFDSLSESIYNHWPLPDNDKGNEISEANITVHISNAFLELRDKKKYYAFSEY